MNKKCVFLHKDRKERAKIQKNKQQICDNTEINAKKNIPHDNNSRRTIGIVYYSQTIKIEI